MSQNDDRNDHWHLDKKVPVGIFLALAIQFVAAVMAFSGVMKDVEYLREGLNEQRERDDKQDRTNAEALQHIRSDIKAVNEKLDRLIERQNKP